MASLEAVTDPSLPRPFRVEIPEHEVQRMKRMIADTRLPDQPLVAGASWEYGTDLEWLQNMRKAWLGLDWSKVEAQMNSFPQYKVEVEGVTLHFIHKTSQRADAVPIILFHGWPGSFWEYHKVINELVNPPPDKPAYHVVVPSLPGFAFSSPPPRQQWSMWDNARIFDHLMTGVLGYKSYMAQGGDWGSALVTILGTSSFPACRLVHLNMAFRRPPLSALLTLPLWILPVSLRQWLYKCIYSETELSYFKRSGEYLKHNMGYFIQQMTRPSSIGYALHDSPVGILSWVGEKYAELMDPDILPERTEDILVTVSIYFLTHTFETTTLPYAENISTIVQKHVITKPLGLSRFKHDIFISPLSWLRGTHHNIVFARDHDRGGHFFALEVPSVFIDDIRELTAGQLTIWSA